MQTKEQTPQHGGQGKEEHQQRQGAIRNQVLRTLGQPVGLYRVQVQRLWEGHSRGNVVLGRDPVSARIARSYFLVTDSDGEIIASAPALERQYYPVAKRA